MKLTIEVQGRKFHVEMDEGITVDGVPVQASQTGTQVRAGNSLFHVEVKGNHATIDGEPEPFFIHHLEGVAGAYVEPGGSHGPVKPPMTGKLEEILVANGDTVAKGDVLFVLEAMKMRNEIKAAVDGTISNLQVEVGAAVDTGTTILSIQPA